MEEQINNLLIELVASGELEPKDSGDMKIALMETIPAELVKQSKDFFKNLKAKFETNFSQIFSENGIDITVIKSITEEVIQLESKTIENKKEEEINIEKNNARRFEESFAESLESNDAKMTEEQVMTEDKLGFPPFKISPEFLNDVSQYINDSGYNLNVDKNMFAQEVMFLIKNGLENGKAMLVTMRSHVGDAVKKSIEEGKKLEETIAQLGIDPDDKDKVADVKGDVAGRLVLDMSAAFARKILDINPNAQKGILVDESLEEEFIEEYIQSERLAEKFDQTIIDFVVFAFKEQTTIMLRNDISNDEKEENQNQHDANSVENGDTTKYYDIRALKAWGKEGGPSKATTLRFTKVFYNKFGFLFAPWFGGSDKRVAEDFRNEIEGQLSEKAAIEAEMQREFSDNRKSDYDFYYESLQKISKIEKIIFDDKKHIEIAVNRRDGAEFNQGEMNDKLDKQLIVDEILRRYFLDGGSLYEHYSEAKELADNSLLSFDELLNKACEYIKGGVTAWGDVNVSNIKENEYRIQNKKLEHRAAELALEAITGKKIKDIVKMTPEEINDIRKSFGNNLMLIKNFEKALTKYTEADRVISESKDSIKQTLEKVMTPDKIEKFKQDRESQEKNDFLGEIDDIYNKKTLEERINFTNSIINDKNLIFSIHKKNGISMEEAAKMYFESNPGRLGRYSIGFENILLGNNPVIKFNAKMIDEIILFQNNKLLDQIEAENNEIDRKIEFGEDAKKDPEKLAELLIAKNDLNNKKRVSNALNELLTDKDGKVKEERNKTIDDMIDTYIITGDSIHSIVKKYEYKTDAFVNSKIKDVDENELMVKIAKRFENYKKGSGKEFLDRERKITEIEIKIQAYEMMQKREDGLESQSNDQLENYRRERRALLSQTYVFNRNYKEHFGYNHYNRLSTDSEPQTEEIPEEKKGATKLNIQGFIMSHGISEKEVVEQHMELKRLAEQTRTQGKESYDQEEITSDDRI